MRIWAVNLQSTVTQGHFRNLKSEFLTLSVDWLTLGK